MKDVVFSMWNAKRWLISVWRGDLLPVTFSKQATDALYTALNEIASDDWSKTDFESDVEPSALYRLKTAAQNFETIFSAELQGASTYYVEQKGIYSTPDLMDRAELALGDSVAVLEDDAKKDFNQAGRCLAFDLPTAAAFHLTRSIESVLRKYHALICAKSSAAGRRPEMATCINELRRSGADAKLLDILDHFRDLHRNTTMHPEVFLDGPEALRLFDIAKSGINAMADKIKEFPAPTVEQVQVAPAIEEASVSEP